MPWGRSYPPQVKFFLEGIEEHTRGRGVNLGKSYQEISKNAEKI